ncbi:MAG: DUF2339 domain-containing protein [Eubacterium sp.]|nr:DUF2339 domain-containing protein [Eubacterium sp.]
MSNIDELQERLNNDRRMLDSILSDMKSIQSELDMMKAAGNNQAASPYKAAKPQMSDQQAQNIQSPYMQQAQNVQSPYMQQVQNVQSPYMQQAQNTQSPYAQPVLPRRQHDSDAESLLGKTIMGVAASVLIFISLVLFAKLLIPLLTDEIKIALMLIVSFGMAAVGLYMWFRKKESVFFLSLGSCGVGAVYISLFLCNAYFHILNDIVLYILILAWSCGVLFLSRYKKLLFLIIGCAGIVISIFFGTASCVRSQDMTMLMVLGIYTFIGILAYLVFTMKDKASYLICSGTGILGVGSILFAAAEINNKLLDSDYELASQPTLILAVLAIVFCAVMIGLNLKLLNEKNKDYLPFVSILNYLLIAYSVYVITREQAVYSIIVMTLSVFLYIVLEIVERRIKRYPGKSLSIGILQGLLTLAAVCACYQIDSMKEYLGIFPVVIVLLLYGFLRDSLFARVLGLVCFGIQAVIFVFFTMSLPMLCYQIISFATLTLLMDYKKTHYSVVYKCASYALFILGLFINGVVMWERSGIDGDYIYIIIVSILGLTNVLAQKTAYGRNWLTDEEEKITKITCYVINALLMILSLGCLFQYDDAILHFVSMLVAVALFFVNSYRFLKGPHEYTKIYVGIKFTILLLCILQSYNAPNYASSIATFILAIACIIFGFAMETKSIRLYGLIISMICVVKLVMIDITYDNTAGHALSFFISGVLCFAISALYSKADKILKKGHETIET